MEHKSIHVQINTTKSAEHVFQCICQVRNWWTLDFTGSAANLHDEFVIHHPGRHYSKQRVVDFVPSQRICWEVIESRLDWINGDKEEWTGTRMEFAITEIKGNTHLDFRHEGLTEEKACFGRCTEGWQMVIAQRLLTFIETDKSLEDEPESSRKDLHVELSVQAAPGEVLSKIAAVGDWWARDFSGSAGEKGDRFTVRFGKTFVDFSITELIPEQKVIWTVTDCNLEWINNKKEWAGSQVVFDLAASTNTTAISFTHIGLTPEVECYKSCEPGWKHHLVDSLVPFINSGKGFPE